MVSFIRSLFARLRRSRASGQASDTGQRPPTDVMTGSGLVVDPARVWVNCAWCEGLVSPEDHYVLPSGEDVHVSCRMRQLDQKIWFWARRAMIEELRPVYVALGKTKEVQDLIFRLYPEEGVALTDAFNVLRALELKVRELKNHDLQTSTEAIASIREARSSVRQLLLRA